LWQHALTESFAYSGIYSAFGVFERSVTLNLNGFTLDCDSLAVNSGSLVTTGIGALNITEFGVYVYEAATEKLRALENTMSFYRDTSEVSLLNRNAGVAPVRVSSELFQLLRLSKDVAEKSENAFNITLAPLIQLWRKAGNELPRPDEIKNALSLCEIENLILDEDSAYLCKKNCMIDLGGIGKGFAADICCGLYREMGVASAFVNLGGNVKTVGNRPDGKPWSVGIQHPDKPRGECFGAVMCSDLSVVTSGAYERFQIIGGEKFHHILDGKTGFPALSDLKSVTVISQSSALADALSTTAFVLGLKKGAELIRAFAETSAVFFSNDNKIFSVGTPNFIHVLTRQ